MIVINSAALTFRLTAAHTTAAGQMMVSYRDITPATPAYVPQSTLANSNGTTAVNLISIPSAGTYSLVDYIGYTNTDTGNQEISVLIGTTIIQKVILSVGERVEYVEGKGWTSYMNNGAAKTSYTNGTSPVSSLTQQVVLASDVTNNNGTANTIADVTGLSFAVVSGTLYRFRFVIMYTAAATTTGSRWSLNGPASPTLLSYNSRLSLTTTTQTTNDGLGAYDLPAASNGSSAVATPGRNIAIIEGWISPSANGTLIARFASEITSSAIVAKVGSFVEYQAI